MTRVYLMRIVSAERQTRLARGEYSRLARQLLCEAVKREFSLDIGKYPEKKGENGKPYLEGAPFCFNLSHSGAYIACALSDVEVGVDIEAVKPISEGVMRRFVGKVGNGDEENTRLWTRYEAVGKCFGTGIPYIEPSGGYFVKEYSDLDGYALTLCAEKDGFAERAIILN